MTTTKKDSEVVNTKKDQHEKRTESGQHEKRSGSGQHEKRSTRKKNRKWSTLKKIRKWSTRKRNRKWSTRKRNRKWPVTFDPWPLTFDLNTKKAVLNYSLLIFDSLITLWGNFDAPYLKLLNDASVASACFYVRTCRRVRNSKKIATIRDFHLPGSFLCLSTRLQQSFECW